MKRCREKTTKSKKRKINRNRNATKLEFLLWKRVWFRKIMESRTKERSKENQQKEREKHPIQKASEITIQSKEQNNEISMQGKRG